jgi:hypothetical protein
VKLALVVGENGGGKTSKQEARIQAALEAGATVLIMRGAAAFAVALVDGARVETKLEQGREAITYWVDEFRAT